MKVIEYWVVSIIMSLMSCYVYAGTTGKISGKVVDAQTGDPVIGASVVIVGTSSGAVELGCVVSGSSVTLEERGNFLSE